MTRKQSGPARLAWLDKATHPLAVWPLPGSFKDSGSSWSVYVGLGVEYVGYYYIDENAGANRFDEGPLIGQLSLGATWQ